MTEQGEGHILTENVTSYLLTSKSGEIFPAKLFTLAKPAGEVSGSEVARVSSQILDVAKRCFTNWTDDGARFTKVLTERANRVSIVYDPTGERIVAFNVYEQGSVTPEGLQSPIDFVYTHYAGVDPQMGPTGKQYRDQGLMEKSRTHDTRTMNPGVIAGCTANGGILKGVRATAKELDRILYPQTDQKVPPAIWKVGQAIYSHVNGEDAGKTVDNDLVRHGSSPYVRGLAHDALIDTLPSTNDAILYASLSKTFASRINSVPLPKVMQ